MNPDRDLGPQPIAALLQSHELSPTDLVRASKEQLTHKMVARAVKGRRLSPHVMAKVLHALNAAAQADYRLEQLFSYAAAPPRAGRGEPAEADRTAGDV